MKYLVQTMEGEIKHDFSFTLLRSFEYYKDWVGEPKEFELSETIKKEKGWIPVGSVEFVLEYLKNNYDIVPKPINIPVPLHQDRFLGRTIVKSNEKFLKNIEGQVFVKSCEKIKGFTEIIDSSYELPIGEYLYSDIIEIESEYRCFVYDKQLIGMQHYIGDFEIFPDTTQIKEMIKAYESSPLSYTLDVAVLESGETVIVEAHDIFSCGLYGFNDLAKLPIMYSRWMLECLKQHGKSFV